MSANRTALILTGGGARAAYQVGVLAGIREIWGRREGNPFPILCGTSAGAVNAAVLACFSENFRDAVRRLTWIWGNFNVKQVYRADALDVVSSVSLWGSSVLWGWLLRRSPRALLDNDPLRELLLRYLDFDQIRRNIAKGNLYAVSVTCSGYSSGESLSFFEAHSNVQPWRRTRRIGLRSAITIDHLMASSAIPFLFPAVKINREYFGDGSMRQIAPISPAIHMGADRLLVIGNGQLEGEKRKGRADRYPTPAQIAGHAMASIFQDSLAVDLERLQRINETWGKIPEDARMNAGVTLKPVETLVICPSERIDFLAAKHARALPWAMRMALRGFGVLGRSGSGVLSYLLFEKAYTRELMHLGKSDVMARRRDVEQFLGIVQERNRSDRVNQAGASVEASAEIA